ncbi:MAG: AAA family ATPase [Clostridia bacterium]|nr:AAA family ATPase [Clostridia bacterium]
MLKRKIEKNINEWIAGGRNALLIKGVRQCGKTFIIHECLEKSGKHFLEFNLKRKDGQEILEIFKDSVTVDELYTRLDIHLPGELEPGTIFFLDEIQVYEQFISKIKMLVADGRFRYILSGSLLGVERVSLDEVPVGYLDTLQMFPLDFEEFLINLNGKNSLVEYLRRCFNDRVPVRKSTHESVMKQLNLYLVVGGMPEAVNEFLASGNLNKVTDVQNNIILQYKVDFTQYEEKNNKLCLSAIYDKIPSGLDSKNKRFTISKVERKQLTEGKEESAHTTPVRYDAIEDSFVWLWKAGVAIPCYNASEPRIPLFENHKASLFKLFLSDVGLLTALCGWVTKDTIMNKAENVRFGSIYENFVAQELTAHKYPLYYYNSNKLGELDFLIEHHDNIMPIEVKSGKDYRDYSALNHFLESEDYGTKIDEALILSNYNVSQKGRAVYMPVYMIMFLTNTMNLGTVNLADYIITDIPED